MEFDELFLTGVAMRLAAAGIGTWKASGSYSSTQIGIVIDAVPQSPANVITLSSYTVDDDPSLSDSVMGLQIRTRAAGQDPRPVRDRANKIFNNLQALTNVRLPAPTGETGVWLVQCLRRSQVGGGQDDNLQWSNIQNFYATVHYPSTYRV